jgi:hypothetical protein
MRMAKIVSTTQTIDGGSFVVATDEQLKNAIKDFFTEPGSVEIEKDLPAPAKTVALNTADLYGVAVNVVNGTGRLGQGALVTAWLTRQGANVLSVKKADAPVDGSAIVTYPKGKADTAKAVARALGIGMTRQSGKSKQIMVTLAKKYAIAGADITTPTPTAGSIAAIKDVGQWQTLAAQASFPLVGPAFVPGTCKYSFQRSYSIQAGDESVPAVRMGYQYGAKDKYLGISETTWLEAPLASPGREVTGPGGIVFTVVGSATKPDHVWWVADGVLHWVTNTLVFDLKREELLATAMSATAVPAGQPALSTASTSTNDTTAATAQ